MSDGRAVGFWSYVHVDNDADGGRIVRLATLVRDEYALLTGDAIEVFVDREHILWGQEWKRRIDQALADTAFFIPVITPRYFRSEECRRELLTFSGHAESLGLKELLLPLMYIPIDKLDPEDEAVILVKKTQYENWTELRLEDENSQTYRRGVNRLAKRLAEINEKFSVQGPAVVVGPADAEDDTDDQPGFLDVVAEAEKAFPLFNDTLVGMTEAVEQIGGFASGATVEMQRSDATGGGASGRIAVAKRFAKLLDEPASRILRLGNEYAAHLVSIDAGILALIRRVEAGGLTPDEHVAACSFFRSIRPLSARSAETGEQLRGLIKSFEVVGAATRDVRPPFRRLRDGLSRIMDGQAIMDEWARRIDAVGLDCEAE